jgi:hypothetical protein
MLKITILDTPDRRLLVLEGKLVAPWTAELRKECRGGPQRTYGAGNSRLN